MDKTSKRIMIELVKYSEESLAYCISDKSYKKICESVSLAEKEFLRCIEYLESDKYLSIVHDLSNEQVGIVMLHKGIHFKEFSREETFDFIKKSIIVPIFVSLAIALLTHCLF